MTDFRAPLLGGVCSLGLIFQLASSDIVHAANMVEMPGGRAAIVIHVADAETPAWAAEATMNPEYNSDDSAAPNQNSGGEIIAESDDASGSTPAWAAPATMNPDYTPGESAAPAAGGDEQAAPAQPAEAEAAPPAAGGNATTEYFGGSAAPANHAWAEPAQMNPDYNAAAPAAASGESSAAASSAGACEETVATNAKSASVHFNEDSAAISKESQAALKSLAEAISSCSSVVVEVQGYTDNVGTVASNKVLSMLRAKKVADFLATSGVDASRLRTTGHGPDNPIGDNSTDEGRHQNRRVELVVSGS
jgi:outer membrane protein OmpA-like peptidoglycan-associated protein